MFHLDLAGRMGEVAEDECWTPITPPRTNGKVRAAHMNDEDEIMTVPEGYVAYSYEEDVKVDPRLAGLEPGQQHIFYPEPGDWPQCGESRYMIPNYDTPDGCDFIWENRPEGWGWGGDGRGLPAAMEEIPRFRCSARKAQIKKQPDIWPWMNHVYLITKRLLDLILEMDPEAVEARPADFLFSDGLPPDEPYCLADFVRTIEAIDHARSVTYYERPSSKIEALQLPKRGRALLFVKLPLAIKQDVPENFHIFRCEYGQSVFFSKTIVQEMVSRRFVRLRFDDPAQGYDPAHVHGGPCPAIYVNGGRVRQ